MSLDKRRPINFQSSFNPNTAIIPQKSPSKEISRTGQIFDASQPNFDSTPNQVHHTGPIRFNTSFDNRQSSEVLPPFPYQRNGNENHGRYHRNPQQIGSFKNPAIKGQSLFDRYNRQMLTIDECNPNDVQIAIKNPLVYEEQLHIESVIKIDSPRKNGSPQSRSPARRTDGRSDQYMQNEVIFNHQKFADQKRAQKTKFLSEIESKIAAMEDETNELKEHQDRQREQVQEIKQIQEGIRSELGINALRGRIDNVLIQTMQTTNQEPRIIDANMQACEINDIIDEEVVGNNDLMVQIEQQLKSMNIQSGTSQWWHNKQKYIEKDGRSSKGNTAVNGFGASMNSSTGMNLKRTLKGKQDSTNKNSQTFTRNKSGKKLMNTANSFSKYTK